MWNELPSGISLTYVHTTDQNDGIPALTFIYDAEGPETPDAPTCQFITGVRLTLVPLEDRKATRQELRFQLFGHQPEGHPEVPFWEYAYETSRRAAKEFYQTIEDYQQFLWIVSTPSIEFRAIVDHRTHAIDERQTHPRSLH